MSVENLSELQKRLEPKDYKRSFLEIVSMFGLAGVDLDHELTEEFFRKSPYRDFNILDGGCGAGVAIEQVTRACIQLLALNPEKDKVNGLGVDFNPLPDQIPIECLKGDKALRSAFAKGDLSALPAADNSVDFGYSVATLQYVQDALRALEEGYRVLREGRSMHFLLSSYNDVSYHPHFGTILDNTPGADEVFRWRWGKSDDFSVVTCTKRSDSRFRGFPYDPLFTVPSLLRLHPVRQHIQRTVYAHRDGVIGKIRKVFQND